MLYLIKKLIFTLTFNFSLSLMLIIGIQNSSVRKKVNLIIGESARVPTSFIIGISFITGSLVGSLITSDSNNERS